MSSPLVVHLLLITNRSNMYNMNEYSSSPSFLEQQKIVLWRKLGFRLRPSAGLVPSALALAQSHSRAVTILNASEGNSPTSLNGDITDEAQGG